MGQTQDYRQKLSSQGLTGSWPLMAEDRVLGSNITDPGRLISTYVWRSPSDLTGFTWNHPAGVRGYKLCLFILKYIGKVIQTFKKS